MITGNIKQKVDAVWQTFWNNGFTQPSAIFEQMTYGVILTVALVVGVLALVVLFPIWVVPYLIYRAIKIRKEDNNGDKHSSGIEDED